MPPRRRIVRASTATTATTISAPMMPTASKGNEPAAFLEAFSGHCEEGMVCPGAWSNCVLVCVVARLRTSSLVDTTPTIKTSLPFTHEQTSPTVLLEEYLKWPP